MAIKYVTTDLGEWGVGVGSPLAAVDVDTNFWEIAERIVALEALPGAAAAIEDITVEGDQMTIIMDDATTFGPYTLPIWTPDFAGVWLPATAYERGTIFTANGATYMVTFDHTSDTVFDPNENDGLGNDYYGLLLEAPEAVLPAGGAVGMVLAKATSDDFDVIWSSAAVPAGGTTGQLLQKASGTDYDTEWGDADDLAGLAPLASPTFTGTPAAPTAAVDTSTTQIATTAYVQAELTDRARLDLEDQTVTGGARVTSKSLGTVTSGTTTLDPGDRAMQHYTNGGAHTLAPGANTGSLFLDITNNASAGAITTSGWTKVSGDAFTTTNGHKFRCSCSIGDAGSLLNVQAMQ